MRDRPLRPAREADCARLTCVDLSPGMLAQAQTRDVYDVLTEAELAAFLASGRTEAFDLAVCVDTLCYFGELESVFAGLHHALRSGAPLVATVERHGDDGPSIHLAPSGRFSHSERYLRTAAAAARMDYAAADPVILRREDRSPVEGFTFTLVRP